MLKEVVINLLKMFIILHSNIDITQQERFFSSHAKSFHWRCSHVPCDLTPVALLL